MTRLFRRLSANRPPNAFGVVLVLLITAAAACALTEQTDVPPGPGSHDPVFRASAMLYTLVREVDRLGRDAGSLPRTLAEVRDAPGIALVDPWGTMYRYSVTENEFEIRSAGRDSSFESDDDVVAIGRLGRTLPCEVRSATLVTRNDNVAPRCDQVGTQLVLKLCPPLGRSDRVDRVVPATQRDSVLAMGLRLVRVARAVDGFGREIGTLPRTLSGPVILNRNSQATPPDLWGQPVRYTPAGTRFELRSPGPDRDHGSEDDIVVAGELGSVIPCRFQTGSDTLTCSEPPPDCD
jgi:hypothetical protein